MRYTLPVDELEDMANIEVGEALRLTRLHYGQSLEDIEVALRIRACQIDAIEHGDMSQLPGRVYAIGFVRSYAEHLGLDGAKAVQLFIAQYMDAQGDCQLSFPTPANETKTPAIWIVAVSVIMAMSLFVFIDKVSANKNMTVMFIQDVPDDIKAHINKDILLKSVTEKVVDPIEMAADEIAVENMGVDEEQKTGIILNVIGDSWVEIKNADGEVLVSKVLNDGDQYFVPDFPGLSMSLGNAANVEIVLDGRALKALGGDGDVRRNIPLSSTYLKTLDFKDRP